MAESDPYSVEYFNGLRVFRPAPLCGLSILGALVPHGIDARQSALKNRNVFLRSKRASPQIIMKRHNYVTYRDNKAIWQAVWKGIGAIVRRHCAALSCGAIVLDFCALRDAGRRRTRYMKSGVSGGSRSGAGFNETHDIVLAVMFGAFRAGRIKEIHSRFATVFMRRHFKERLAPFRRVLVCAFKDFRAVVA